MITYALAFIALLFLVLIDVGGYTRSPTLAPQNLRMLVDSHLMFSKHVNSVCKSAFFSVSNIGRIGKYLDRDKCFLLYLKPVTKLYRDRSFAAWAPLLWNALPVDNKSSESLNFFRSKVERLLFR